MTFNDARQLYVSSNGDHWDCGRDEHGKLVIRHTPNIASGGKPHIISLAKFLDADHYGPEHEALIASVLKH
jgi:hypothetical protein